MTATVKLNSGGEMPGIGFGTWRLEAGREAANSVSAAIRAGYRLIDTAKIYDNERSVGLAVRGSGLPREDFFITTKLWPTDFINAQTAFKASLERLGMDYADLYLTHWPDGSSRREAWRVLENIYEHGKARAIGVSNYTAEHLEEMPSYATVIPAVNQIEFHPFNYRRQRPVLELCRDRGIMVEAYSPLARGRQMDNEVITGIADETARTPAQVILRWALQHGTVPIPKSSHPERISQNLQVFDFELSEAHMAALNDLS